jgi:hypothetical protein
VSNGFVGRARGAFTGPASAFAYPARFFAIGLELADECPHDAIQHRRPAMRDEHQGLHRILPLPSPKRRTRTVSANGPGAAAISPKRHTPAGLSAFSVSMRLVRRLTGFSTGKRSLHFLGSLSWQERLIPEAGTVYQSLGKGVCLLRLRQVDARPVHQMAYRSWSL